MPSYEPIISIPISKKEPHNKVVINSEINKEEKEALEILLKEYIDMFTCTVSNMIRIDCHVAQHHLDILTEVCSIK